MTRRTDEEIVAAEELRARANGLVGPDGIRQGSARGHRTMIQTKPTSRQRCSCGCGKRATYLGLGDGVCLMSGCEWRVRRWVRDGR